MISRGTREKGERREEGEGRSDLEMLRVSALLDERGCKLLT